MLKCSNSFFLGESSRTQAERDASHIAKHIFEHKPTATDERDLYQLAGLTHLRDSTRRKRAFETLKLNGWIAQTENQNKGRKRSDWDTNANIWRTL